MELTQKRLKELLHYNPETGIFHWISAPGRRIDKVSKPAGNKNNSGYIRIQVDGIMVMAHRLAWIYMTGRDTESLIDHINMVKSDNRWINLREATKSQNGANCRPRAKSGLKGAYWSKQIQRWYSRIGKKYLGTFDTAEEAHAAYVLAANKEFGEYARPV